LVSAWHKKLAVKTKLITRYYTSPPPYTLEFIPDPLAISQHSIQNVLRTSNRRNNLKETNVKTFVLQIIPHLRNPKKVATRRKESLFMTQAVCWKGTGKYPP